MRRGGSAAALPRVTPYRDYLALIARQDRAAALAAWRESLAGLEEGTRLCAAGRRTGRRGGCARADRAVAGAALSAALDRAARERAVTLNTLMQTAWGMLLGRLTGRDDVVFGVTVAGRPAELAGVEHMVGLFINTLPLRMPLPPQLPLSELLRQTQEQPVAADGASACRAWPRSSRRRVLGELFDTLMVFENYPVDRAGPGGAGAAGSGSAGSRATMRRIIRWR